MGVDFVGRWVVVYRETFLKGVGCDEIGICSTHMYFGTCTLCIFACLADARANNKTTLIKW